MSKTSVEIAAEVGLRAARLPASSASVHELLIQADRQARVKETGKPSVYSRGSLVTAAALFVQAIEAHDKATREMARRSLHAVADLPDRFLGDPR